MADMNEQQLNSIQYWKNQMDIIKSRAILKLGKIDGRLQCQIASADRMKDNAIRRAAIRAELCEKIAEAKIERLQSLIDRLRGGSG